MKEFIDLVQELADRGCWALLESCNPSGGDEKYYCLSCRAQFVLNRHKATK